MQLSTFRQASCVPRFLASTVAAIARDENLHQEGGPIVVTHSGERGASRAMKYLLVELRRNNNAKHIEWKLQDSGAFS